MSLSQQDIAAIIAALKENKLDEALLTQSGVETKNESGSQEPSTQNKPKAIPTTAVGPTPAKPESSASDLANLQGTPRPTENLQTASILEICSRIAFSKDVEHEPSRFLPSSVRMYRLLHEIDSLLVQNRYFRQAIPSFLPTHSRIYMGIIFIVQVLRCMRHVNILSHRDIQFLDTFFMQHPVETLPIPGPLIPFLQALCVSNPQDGTMPRVTPALPEQLGPAQAQTLYQNAHNFVVPNIPMLFGLHEHVAGLVAAQAQPDADAILVALGIDGATTANITINGFVYTPGFIAPVTNNQAWMATSAGLAHPLEINSDLLSMFKPNRRFVPIPRLTGNQAIRSPAEFTRVLDGSWFSTLKRNMAIYCRFVKGSGTMQNLSLESHAAGQIISQIITVGIQARPNGFFQDTSLFPGDATYSTTMAANDRMAELTAIYSQIHSRIRNHPHAQLNLIGEDGTANGRQGTFWDIRPVRPETSNDHVKDSLGSEIARFVRERADRD